jgi:hypothetical protein
MVSKVFIISAVIAYVEARFGQEQLPIAAIQAVKGGNSGQASTIAGAAISDLLGAANSCAKVRLRYYIDLTNITLTSPAHPRRPNLHRARWRR